MNITLIKLRCLVSILAVSPAFGFITYHSDKLERVVLEHEKFIKFVPCGNTALTEQDMKPSTDAMIAHCATRTNIAPYKIESHLFYKNLYSLFNVPTRLYEKEIESKNTSFMKLLEGSILTATPLTAFDEVTNKNFILAHTRVLQYLSGSRHLLWQNMNPSFPLVATVVDATVSIFSDGEHIFRTGAPVGISSTIALTARIEAEKSCPKHWMTMPLVVASQTKNWSDVAAWARGQLGDEAMINTSKFVDTKIDNQQTDDNGQTQTIQSPISWPIVTTQQLRLSVAATNALTALLNSPSGATLLTDNSLPRKTELLKKSITADAYNAKACTDENGNIDHVRLAQLPHYPFMCFRRIPLMLLENNPQDYQENNSDLFYDFENANASDSTSQKMFSTTAHSFLFQSMGMHKYWEEKLGYAIFVHGKLSLQSVTAYRNDLGKAVRRTMTTKQFIDAMKIYD